MAINRMQSEANTKEPENVKPIKFEEKNDYVPNDNTFITESKQRAVPMVEMFSQDKEPKEYQDHM